MAEKPTAAYILSLIGALFIFLNGLLWAFVLSIPGIIGLAFFIIPGLPFLILAAIAIIISILTLYGAMMMNTTNVDKVRMGSILVLVFSIISLIGGGGFIIGFLLCLVGSILGLTWKPTEAPPPPPPT